jgi:hypothetical protein
MSFPVWVSELEYDLHKAGTENGGLYAYVDVNDLAKLAQLLYHLERAVEHEETLTRLKHYLPLKHFIDSTLEIANEQANAKESVEAD